MVDDPYTFGQIAAANALSDVYAMGGRPLCAMNIVCFPSKTMSFSILHEILRGGLDKLNEAETVLAGGHSIDDAELKYGLSVTGTVHPDRVLMNRGARAGDRLVLTKPIGSGVLCTALKAGLATSDEIDAMAAVLCRLNARAADVMNRFEVHACTDVTGFGLAGHLCEMIEGEPVGMVISAKVIPLLRGVTAYATMGLLPGGLHRNREFRSRMVSFAEGVAPEMRDLVFDPMTSGGLLIALPAADAPALVEQMQAAGVGDAVVIGEVVSDPPGRLLFQP